MIVIRDSVYVRSAEGYTKCTLRKRNIDGRDAFYFKETTSKIKNLPTEYEIMTMQEIIAKYGSDAIDDDDVGVLGSKGR